MKFGKPKLFYVLVGSIKKKLKLFVVMF